MARTSFLVKYKDRGQTGTGTDFYRTTCSCIPRVAKFLDIDTKEYVPSEADIVERAGYTRTYVKPDGTDGTITVAAGTKTYLASGKPGARTIILTTGRKTTKGTRRKLSFTFPSYLGVAEIGDVLGDLIPATKVNRTGSTGDADIFPYFTIKGGGTYPIPLQTVAEASTDTDAAGTPAEEVTILTGTKSRKKKVAPLAPAA
ncbi:hypothetical protein QT979_08600 [Microcoleus sp. w2-18bC1]